jgi:DNA-binding IclR family transcriptional regulator
VRHRGYAWVRDEFAEGITSVAAPLIRSGGPVVAAIHIHGPTYRFPPRGTEAAIGADIVRAARRLTESLDRR